MLLIRILTACLLMVALHTQAVIETYEFESESNRERYQQFVDELRCPKCQNQNLSGSNSPIAKDLRRELHRMIEKGMDDETIKDFMVQRYGNFVLYRPPLDKKTLVLWMAPLILGFIAIIMIIMFKRNISRQSVTGELTATEQEKLEQLLRQYSS